MDNYSDSEVLNYLLTHGEYDLSAIRQELDAIKDKEILERHHNKIWQGRDGAYYTHLPDGKRTLLRRVSHDDLCMDIISFYKNMGTHLTIDKLFYLWLDYKLQMHEIKKETYDRYKADYIRYIEGTLFDQSLIDSITEDALENFIRKTIIDNHLTQKAFSGLRTILYGMFKYAKKQKYTTLSISSFFQDLDLSSRIFAINTKSRENQVFNESEIPLLLDWLTCHPCIERYGILLDFYTGLRVGELSALKYSDLTGKELHIQRQEIYYLDDDHKYFYEVVDYTKTHAGNRYIILPEQAIIIFNKIHEMNPSGEYLFEKNGHRIHKIRFNNYLYLACDAVGIPRRSMHKIRKTYGTMLINDGVDDALIMSQMGHSDIATTRKYYYFANKNRIHNQEQIEHAVNYAVKTDSSDS
ncbi:MAG: tyrosine-type recombinase/integrase [Lachnospiraceae bacterium]|nr:tyrosine-type recombinase/integrase [Lachnospiraceae bacterium]